MDSPPRSHLSRPGQRSPVIEKAIEVNEKNRKISKSLFWGCINGVLCAIIAYDVSHQCPHIKTVTDYVEYGLATLFFLNMIYHICCYTFYTSTMTPVKITAAQQRMLGFKDGDSSFILQSNVNTSSTPKPTAMNISSLSWRSFDEDSYISSPYVVPDHPARKLNESTKRSPAQSPPRPDTSGVEFITDENSLSQYLKDYQSHDRPLTTSPELSIGRTPIWSHPSSREPLSSILANTQYQLAPKITEGNNSPVGGDKTGSPLPQHGLSEFWWKRSIDPISLAQGCDNLRMWISTTILARLVEEIRKVDEHFARHGQPDIQIGRTGLERLRHSVASSQHAPATLATLLPFLELSSCQEYLVKRIKDLSKGGCMSEFRWNTGGSSNGRPWEPHLPTDCAVVMHIFATYLDTQLPPLPQQPEGKPFTSQYISKKAGEKPDKNNIKLMIHPSVINPPHYVLIVDEEIVDPPKGRNNMFYTMLLFLNEIMRNHHGMLGRVNLGPGGVNVLWVLSR